MLIGQLAKRSGFSKDTIRYYEKIGLIVLSRRSRLDRSYKDYPEAVLQTLKAIRKFKDLGFTLEEIRELLVLRSIKVLDMEKMLQIIDLKITGIDEQIEKLHQYRMRLNEERQTIFKRQRSYIIEIPEIKMAA